MINTGVIGAGRIGAIHAANVAAHPRMRLVSVCDPVPGAAQRVAKPLGAASCEDVADIFGNPDIQALVICSPTATHVPFIKQGIASGKAVLSEKPVDLDLANARACLAELGTDAKVMLGFNRRFDPSFAEVHARFEAGEIGALEQVTIISRDPNPPSPEYVAGSGGIFRDMTIHDFDMARFFLGDIASVQATGQNVVDPGIKAAGDYDAAVITMTNAAGAVATIINNRRCAYGYDQRLEVFGSAGSLQAANQRLTSVSASTATQTDAAGRVMDFFLDRYAIAYRNELGAFVAGVEAGPSFAPSLRDGVEALAVADAALQSATTGNTVTL